MADSTADEAAIRRLMDLYGSGVDERDWDAFARIFDDPIDTDFSGMNAAIAPAVLPRDRHVANARAVIGQFDATQHMITNVQVTLDGDRATARAVMRAEHWIGGIRGNSRYTMFGVYENGFRRTAEGWRISRLVLRLVREEGNLDVWNEAVRRATAS
jgi:3-phenylpropionate/cinnamic acid dioxygenase small subunit